MSSAGAVTVPRSANSVAEPSSPQRLIALDGLRGIAALVVVFHHIYQIARPFIEPHQDAWAFGSLWWLISSTPIKLLSAGSEAVLVFFILSGLVVPLPALKRGVAFSWSGFLATRLVRLYLPAWASLTFATLCILLIPRNHASVTDGSWLERSNPSSVSVHDFLAQATLMQASDPINTVLWSLRWELAFSVLLPVFVLLARLIRRWWYLAVAGCFALTLVGKLFVDSDALLYLPVFFIGTLMAVNLEDIRAWIARRRGSRGAVALWWATFIASTLAIVVSWMARPIIPAGTPLSDTLGSLSAIGGAGLILAAIGFEPTTRWLSSRGPQWLGRMSFSLYLVHLPILVSLAFVLGDRLWWVVALIGIPLSLVAAWGFYLVIERPSHRLAKRAGRAVKESTGQVTVRLQSRRA